MNEAQLLLIETETSKTKLDLIANAVKSHLVGGIVDNKTIIGQDFFINLLFDSDKNEVVTYNTSFINRIANFDPAIAIYHTNNEKYGKNENEGRIETTGLVYIDILIRHDDSGKATEICGRIMDKARQTLMTNTNLFGHTSKLRFTSKEMLSVHENDVLYTRIGRLQIECKYVPQIISTR